MNFPRRHDAGRNREIARRRAALQFRAISPGSHSTMIAEREAVAAGMVRLSQQPGDCRHP